MMDKYRGSSKEFIALMQRLGSFECHDLGWQVVLRGREGEVVVFYLNTGTVQFQGKAAPSARLRQRFVQVAGDKYHLAVTKRQALLGLN